MATYAMSDIHGMYGKYMEMLKKIGFSDKDTLFVLGDVVDRGPEPVRVIQDMMSRPNVFGLMGNHDLFALDMMSRLTKEITEENYDTGIDDELLRQLNAWYSEGGGSTMDGFMSLSPKDRLDAVEYLREFSLYEIIDVGDRTFVMIHAGLGGYYPGKKLSQYSAEELISSRCDPTIRYFEDDQVFLVTGHTPTPTIIGEPKILRSGNNFLIDCGDCFAGRLACLRLDDLEEFYV